ncbi:hypothetical protein MBLNU457_g2961t1 [Dothideomycetes sp. NU457]
MPSRQIFAFFGAGTSALPLAHVLRAGHYASTLARNSNKLRQQMLDRGVDQATIDGHLHIVEGSIYNINDVKATLSSEFGQAHTVISGMGGSAAFQLSTFSMKMEDPKAVTKAMETILLALKELDLQPKPRLIALSSMGVLRERDFPIAYYPICRWILTEVFEDKRGMEAHMNDSSLNTGVAGSFIVRPCALTDGEKGVTAVRSGTGKNRPLGYTIGRPDVANWIYENLIKEEKFTMADGTVLDMSICY